MDVKIDRLDLFPVPLLGTEFPSAKELQKVLMPKFKEIEENDKNPMPYSANSYTNYNPMQQAIDLDMCKDLKAFIVMCGEEANKMLGVDASVMFTGSWFSINRLHGLHHGHNHIPSTWSGVYYVQAEEDDAPITFFDKNKESNWPWMNFAQGNAYNTPTYSIKPRTGRLIMFPSFLWHQVDQQMVDRERATISFNLAAQNDYAK